MNCFMAICRKVRNPSSPISADFGAKNMIQKIKNLLTRPAIRYPILFLLSILIGCSAYAMNASVLVGNQFPMPFGYGLSVIVSGSMEPTLSAGDLILIQEQESYSEGDVVAFQVGDMGVVHRILRIEDGMAVTRGDANNASDEPVPLDAIRGTVIWSVPVIGRWIWYLKTPAGILAMIVLAVLLIELSYRPDRKKEDPEAERLKAEIQLLKAELKEHEIHTNSEFQGGGKT